MAAFQYEPLASEQKIRLVKLSKDRPTRPIIRCDLLTCELSNAPEYYGVSYSWGDHDPSSVLCNGSRLDISSGLYEALLPLQRFSQDDAIKYFWIDQICINQADLDERAQQVQLMPSIFRQAQRTLIWLGPYDRYLDGDVFELLDRVFENVPDLENARRSTSQPISSAENAHLGLPDFTSRAWADLARFVRRPWFSRVWVIQEAALSKSPPVILCGDIAYSHGRLFNTLRWLKLRYYPNITKHGYFAYALHYSRYIRAFWNPTTRQPRPWTLEALMLNTICVKATDARDRVYALLGLIDDTHHNTQEDVLRPDYRRAQYDTFGMITRYCIQKSNRLAILGTGGVDLFQLEHQMGNGGCSPPSWVPRWDRSEDLRIRKRVPCLIDLGINGHGIVDTRLRYPYNPARNIPVCIQTTSNAQELVLKGLAVDSIVWCSDILNGNGLNDWETTAIPSLWEMSLEKLSIQASANNQMFLEFARAFFETFTGGRDAQWDSMKHLPMKDFWRFLFCCYERSGLCSTIDPSLLAMYDRLGSGGNIRHVSTCMLGSRFFVTKNKGIGFGAAALDEGDDIFILFGGNVPYVLRRAHDGFLFVGEAYVQGVMDGEAIERWQMGLLTEEWVTLR